MTWATVQSAETGDLHVVPWDDARAAVANDHRLTSVCSCQPRMLRDGPLEDGIVSHRDPGWPGSLEEGRLS